MPIHCYSFLNYAQQNKKIDFLQNCFPDIFFYVFPIIQNSIFTFNFTYLYFQRIKLRRDLSLNAQRYLHLLQITSEDKNKHTVILENNYMTSNEPIIIDLWKSKTCYC